MTTYMQCSCGWVHHLLTPEEAQGIDDRASYERCRRCGLSSALFLPVAQAPSGASIPACIVDPLLHRCKTLVARFGYQFRDADQEEHAYVFHAGWMVVFEELCAEVDSALGSHKDDFRWIQLKEKMGRPRWYWSLEERQRVVDVFAFLPDDKGVLISDIAIDTDSLTSELQRLVGLAHDRAARLCNVCGQAGELDPRPWMLVLCPEHALIRKQPEEWSRVRRTVRGAELRLASMQDIARARELLRDEVRRIVRESGTGGDAAADAWLDEWLQQPVPALGGRRPGDLLPHRVDEVLVLVRRLQSGAYS